MTPYIGNRFPLTGVTMMSLHVSTNSPEQTNYILDLERRFGVFVFYFFRLLIPATLLDSPVIG